MKNFGNYTCIFGGGAIRGVAYVGAIDVLEELNIYIDTFAGSSVGSVIATLLAVGYNASEIKDIIMDVKYDLFRDISFGINKDFAISKGNIFTEWIRELIEKKYYQDKYDRNNNEPVTFGMIKRNLVILTTDINTFKPHEFSTFETKDYEIANAVRISCSMPGLMSPVEYKDKQLVDGDLLKGVPLWKLSKNLNNPKNRIIEFRLEGETIDKPSNPLDFLNSIYSCMTSASTEFMTELYGNNDRYDYVTINTGDVIILDFNLKEKDRCELIQSGYNQCFEYFTKKIKIKKNHCLQYYTDIITFLEKLKKVLKLASVEETKNVLKEFYVYSSDNFIFLDENLTEGIRVLKRDIMNSEIKKSWFRGSKFVNNKSLIRDCELLNTFAKIKKTEIENYLKII